MLATEEDVLDGEPVEVESALRREIDSRTWRGVKGLRVETMRDRVLVKGTTSSYYLKQLALEAIKEVARSSSVPPVTLDIQVRGGQSRTRENVM